MRRMGALCDLTGPRVRRPWPRRLALLHGAVQVVGRLDVVELPIDGTQDVGLEGDV